jgi:hypothetical protein
MLDRSGAGRRRSDAGLQQCLGELRPYRRDQQCAQAASWRGCGTPGLQRRRTGRLVGRPHRVLAGVGLGVGEVAGYRRSLEYRPFEAKWFYGVYAACVVGAAALVWFMPDLVWLNIAAQVLNAFLLPLVIGFLVALAMKALPEPLRLRGFYLWVLIGIWAIVIAVGLFGGVSGLL